MAEKEVTYTAPEGGDDLPPFIGLFKPIPNLQGITLYTGTTAIMVNVTPTDINAPLGIKAWFAIFLNDDLQKVGQLGSDETLSLDSTVEVTDTDTVSVKWRSGVGVTNHLAAGGTARAIISMDIGG